ncbi:MAG: helix-turn-helix transcriptional regulator [Gemmatimonadota bacterium]
MDRLGSFEELVLIVVGRQAGEGYAVTIQDALECECHEEISLGAVYATLDRLEQKKLLRSSVGGATSERGGRRKRYFELTAPGAAALRQMQEIRARLHAGSAIRA